MNQQLIVVDLTRFTQEQLARFCCELNNWEWPAELGEPEPVPTGEQIRAGGVHAVMPRRSHYMETIRAMIGSRAINRYHNRATMSDEEHAWWWKEHHGDAR